jgi:hypothetical protein
MNTDALIPKDWAHVVSTLTFFVSTYATAPSPSEIHLILNSVSAELR